MDNAIKDYEGQDTVVDYLRMAEAIFVDREREFVSDYEGADYPRETWRDMMWAIYGVESEPLED